MTLRLPKQRQSKPIWQHTAALLMDAHTSGKPDDLHHAIRQIYRALYPEGLPAYPPDLVKLMHDEEKRLYELRRARKGRRAD